MHERQQGADPRFSSKLIADPIGQPTGRGAGICLVPGGQWVGLETGRSTEASGRRIARSGLRSTSASFGTAARLAAQQHPVVLSEKAAARRAAAARFQGSFTLTAIFRARFSGGRLRRAARRWETMAERIAGPISKGPKGCAG